MSPQDLIAAFDTAADAYVRLAGGHAFFNVMAAERPDWREFAEAAADVGRRSDVSFDDLKAALHQLQDAGLADRGNQAFYDALIASHQRAAAAVKHVTTRHVSRPVASAALAAA